MTANNGVRTSTETVSVPVDAGTPVAGTPTVGSPNSSTGAVTGAVAFTDPAGRTLSYSAPTLSTAGGTVSINASTGSYSYAPTAAQIQAATLTTTDTFTVTASNGVHTATETVNVPVIPDIPVAGTPTVGNPDPGTGAVTGAVAFTDPAGQTLTYTAPATTTGGGSVSINTSTGAFTYNPTQAQRQSAGPNTVDTVTVTASNGVYTSTDTVTVPIGLNVYVAEPHTDKVEVLNTATGTVTGTIPVGSNPSGVAISPNGSTVYVTNDDTPGTVSVINTATTPSQPPSLSEMTRTRLRSAPTAAPSTSPSRTPTRCR